MLGEAKRPLIYAGGGVIHSGGAQALRELATRAANSGRHHAHGARCVRHDAPDCRCTCSACMAPPLRTTQSTIAISCSRSARGSMIALPAIRRSSRRTPSTHRSDRYRRVGDQQGEAGAIGITSGSLPEALRALRAYGRRIGFNRDWSAWHMPLRRAQAQARDELRSRERADSAVSRHRRDQQADARAKPSSAPASGNIRCGRRSTSISANRVCG